MSYVRTRLGRWFYEERGVTKRSGDPAIVLWPSLLFDGGMWKHQIEPLAALGRVVVFDPPGHGKSEVPPPFSLEDNADALSEADRDFYRGKIAVARFFATTVLPRLETERKIIEQTALDLMDVPEAAF